MQGQKSDGRIRTLLLWGGTAALFGVAIATMAFDGWFGALATPLRSLAIIGGMIGSYVAMKATQENEGALPNDVRTTAICDATSPTVHREREHSSGTPIPGLPDLVNDRQSRGKSR